MHREPANSIRESDTRSVCSRVRVGAVAVVNVRNRHVVLAGDRRHRGISHEPPEAVGTVLLVVRPAPLLDSNGLVRDDLLEEYAVGLRGRLESHSRECRGPQRVGGQVVERVGRHDVSAVAVAYLHEEPRDFWVLVVVADPRAYIFERGGRVRHIDAQVVGKRRELRNGIDVAVVRPIPGATSKQKPRHGP